MTYTVKRERCTWIRDGKFAEARITHPVLWTVYENGEAVRFFDTKSEADEWIAIETGV